ncbi:MAG TPA: hypothetical protein VN132_04520 [Bdellovibrio sp.]|nr:hypothetical protein [Bdellovibrio sp.]
MKNMIKAIVLVSAITIQFQPAHAIDALTEGKLAAVEADAAEQDAKAIQAIRAEAASQLNQINSIYNIIYDRLVDRFSGETADLDKGEVADGAAKIGTEVSTAKAIAADIAAGTSKAALQESLQDLKMILQEVKDAEQSLR